MTHKPLARHYGRREIPSMKAAAVLAALAFALSGCQTREQAWQNAYNEKRATALRNGWEPARREIPMAPKPQLARNNPPMMAGGPPVIMPPPIIVEAPSAPPPQRSAPMPIIFTGGGSGTTIATQSEYGTVVSQIGGPNSGTTIATQSDYGTVISRFGGPLPMSGYRPFCPQPVGYSFGY